MKQLSRCRRRGRGQIVHFRQTHRQAASRRIAGNAAAIDSAADDEKIVNLARHIHCAFLAGLILPKPAAAMAQTNTNENNNLQNYSFLTSFEELTPDFKPSKVC